MKRQLLVLVPLMSALAAPAASVTWDGSASGYWSNGANWVGGVAPAPGDSLVFPVSAARYLTTNNFASGTAFGGIGVNGSNYVFRGNRIVLQDDLRALAQSGPVTFDLAITVDGPLLVTQFEARFASVPTFNGAIQLVDPAHSLQFINGQINVAGAITGAGSVQVTACDLFLFGSGVNTYTGGTRLSGATLHLNKTVADAALPPNGLVERAGGISYVRWIRDEQVADSAHLDGLYLDLNGQTETLDDFHTSNLLTNGTLSIERDIVGSGAYLSGNGNGRIHLNPGDHQILSDGNNSISSVRYELTGPGNLVKMGTGRMWLENSNSFTGLLIVSNGVVELRHDYALGSTNAGVIVHAGATLSLRNSVRVQGEPLSLEGTGYFDPEAAEWLPYGYGALHSISPTNAWNGPITLNGAASIGSQEQGLGPVLTNSFLHLGGAISGYGPLFKEGQGAVVLTGTDANTYTESTVVRQGTLKLDKTGAIAIPALLSIGLAGVVSTARVDVVRGAQIADDSDVTINPGGQLHMNNQSDIIRNLRLVDGTLYTDNGALVVSGNVTAIDAPELPYANTIYGANTGRLLFSPAAHDITLIEDVSGDIVLNVGAEIGGSGALRLLGDGYLHLASSNSFTGLLTVSSRGLAISSGYALGGTNNGTIVSSNATLALYGIWVNGESLTLRGGASLYAAFNLPAWWNGPITLPDAETHATAWGTSLQQNGWLTLGGAVSGPGDLRIDGGQVMLSGNQNNTQSGDVIVLDGTLLLSKTNATAIASQLYIGYFNVPGTATVRHLRPNQIADTAGVYLSDTCVWDLDGFSETVGGLGGVSGSEVHLGAATLTVDKGDTGHYGYWGILSGTGGYIKRGTGSTLLAGNNSYTGPTLIEGGNQGIWGEQPQSDVTLSVGATLSGFGTLGRVHAASGATVAAGYIFYEPVLTTSNLTLQAGSTLELILYGPGSNQLVRVRGGVSLNGANLGLNWKYFPQPGDTFKLIDNDGAEPVNGTFAGIPAGPFTAPNGLLMEMIYGNDVTLRVLSPGHTNLPPGIGLNVWGGNGNGVIDPNECNQLRIAVFNNGTNALPPFQAMLVCDAPEVIVTQPASAYPAIPAQDSAQNLTPFQIATAGSLVCGSNIPCRLLILTTNASAYAIDLSLPTGSPNLAAPVTYTAAPNAPVLDGILTESSIPVALLPGHLARVEVSVFIEHALSSDLTLTLVAPDGTEVLLAEDLGNGMNYGSSCADADRTTFADDAPAAIGSVGAPFVGTYRPAGWLSTLRGMPGSAVAGNWKLRVNDHVHFNTGMLRCWSLTLTPATCTDGGGQCDPCPGVIVDAVEVDAPLANGHLNPYSGDASTCFSNKPAPSVVAGSQPYRVHTFTNLNAQPTCVSVRFTPKCEVDPVNKLGAAAYLGAFDPANVVANFLGNPAVSLGGGVPRTFSFQVPGSNVFQIVVTAIDTPACTGYSLEVMSPDLCAVALNISALSASTMRLDWPTHAAGYELQRTPAFAPSSWNNVNAQPVVTGSRFVVTNEVADPNGFYRLHKP